MNEPITILDIIAPELIEALQISEPVLKSLDKFFEDAHTLNRTDIENRIMAAITETEEKAFKAGFSAAIQLINGR